MREAARGLDRRLDIFNAGTASDIDAAFATLTQRRGAALVVMADQYFDDSLRAQLVALAARHVTPRDLRATRIRDRGQTDQLRHQPRRNASASR